jgi:hypothetical protein
VASPSRFTCAACGGTFTIGWTKEQAQAEKTANGFDVYKCVQVCDDCYKILMDGLYQ